MQNLTELRPFFLYSLVLRISYSSILLLSTFPCSHGLGTITNRFSMPQNPYTNAGSMWQVAQATWGSPAAASAAVEAIASTAAGAASGMLWGPSTRNPCLTLLSMHHRHPLGSAGGSQSCKGTHLWSVLGE